MTTNPNYKNISLTIDDSLFNFRIDKAASLLLPEYSRGDIQKAIKAGHIIVDGQQQSVAPSFKVTQEMTLYISLPTNEKQPLSGEPINFDIVYEDDDIIVINKPPFLTVHPGAGITNGTLVQGLIHRLGIDNLASDCGDDRPGILHRLDKDTSGLLIVCKTNEAYGILKQDLANRDIHRIYNAIVWGTPSPREGSIDAMIGRNPKNRLKMNIVPDGGREAVTHYSIIQPLGLHFSLVECELETGRTHQIRVHMSHIGHPVVGDPLYTLKEHARLKRIDTDIANYIRDFPRQALHAKRLEFTHPITHENMTFESKLPDDFEELIVKLQKS